MCLAADPFVSYDFKVSKFLNSKGRGREQEDPSRTRLRHDPSSPVLSLSSPVSNSSL
ncbi:unnamed protein product [Brassica oleracea var. botrytis]|uniref:(rape) hypothetical protein n=1 Tax=Brassica napus TaxID=3708 RepID=A0A816I005_BRANA|nr:unnamed protein product [Brassica napus]